jgi:hypothetical protein
MHYLVQTTPVSDDGSQLEHFPLSGEEGLAELQAHGFVSLMTEPFVASVIASKLVRPVSVVQEQNGKLRLRRGDVAMSPRTPLHGDVGLTSLEWEVWRQ